MAENNNRRRISHYVPDQLADRFDEESTKYPALTKQGFFAMVLLIGMKALDYDLDAYWGWAIIELGKLSEGNDG